MKEMQTMQSNAQRPESTPDVLEIASTSFFFPDSSVLIGKVAELQANSPGYQAVLAEIQSRNLNLRVSADEGGVQPFGWTSIDDGVINPPVKSFTFIQDFGSSEGTDFGLATTVISGNDPNTNAPVRQEIHELVSKPSAGVTDPETDIRVVFAAREDGALMTPAVGTASILSRFVACIRSSCAETCLGSLVGCAGAFPVYVQCVAVACGGCALKCGACAGCNCGFWCKWAAGCCED
jgi:hypothetical protein